MLDAGPDVVTEAVSGPRHALILMCGDREGRLFHSRVAVLDIETKKRGHWVALATAHGLRDKTECHVQDETGQRRQVRAMAFAPDPQEDWAVIRFRALPDGTAHRYALKPQSADMADFSRARGFLHNTRRCRLVGFQALEQNQPTDLHHLHSCRAQKGQSGTPLTRDTGEGPELVGLHVGQAHFWRFDIGKGRRSYGRYLPMTVDRVAAIEAAAARLAGP